MSSTKNQPTEFDRFRALARRILTTPKAELVKHTPKKQQAKRAIKKRK